MPVTLVAAAVAALVLLLAGWASAHTGTAGSPARSASCENAETTVADAEAKQLRKAVACLVNRARAEHDEAKLGRERPLQRAARKHAKVMAATDCLDLRCPGEPDLEGRLRKAGYFEGARRWEFAENSGCAMSAEAMVESWLASSVHRLNLLDPKFAEIGVGVSIEGPPKRCESGFAAFVATFGWRKI